MTPYGISPELVAMHSTEPTKNPSSARNLFLGLAGGGGR